MSLAAKAFYNQLIAEKVTNPAFRIESVEYYYIKHFSIKNTWKIEPTGELSEELKNLIGFVNEVDFDKAIIKYKEAFKPKNEDERFTDKFMEMLDKYNIPIK